MKGTWKNIICMLAGLWLCISPFVLHFRLGSDASIDADIVGIYIGMLSMIALATPQMWEEWAKVILGVWLLASPWLLGFVHQIVAVGDIMIVGMLVVILSFWPLANRVLARRSKARPPKLPPSATELLVQTMNFRRGSTDVENPR